MIKLRSFIVALFFALTSVIATGQTTTDQQLAQHYYNNGEFEKAITYYEKLYKSEPNKFHFNRLFDCYKQTSNTKEAEKLIKKQVADNKGDNEYLVLQGKFYDEIGETEKADKIYNSLIDDLPARPNEIVKLFNLFKAEAKNDLAYETIVKGRKLLNNSYPLNFQFAEYYGSVGETDKMMQEYLDLIDYHPSYKSSIQKVLARQIDFSKSESDEYIILKNELLKRVQKDPSNEVYSDMLIWTFIQAKNFNVALAQIQALDKRTNGNGAKVFELGVICVQNKAYETARNAFKYVTNLGDDKPFYYKALNALLNTRFLEITTQRNYSQAEIQETINEYNLVINKAGKTRVTVPLILEKCHIEAFYGNKAQEAINLLSETLELPGLTDMQRAEIKMELGDIEVLHGDIWEASLYYMQIDKAFKYEPIGHEARFKNARIFYYDGEFDYAQSQLDVLKQATSKLISNNAIELSLLITDNFGLDSNYTAMYWFASADLLIEQHQYKQAFQLFDSIMTNFPYHSLGDEILLKKSLAAELQGNWENAIEYLDELLKYYGEDILADNAIYRKGLIYEDQLKNTEQAMECYKDILLNFKGSLYSTEARKRFRKLRGESFDEEDIERQTP